MCMLLLGVMTGLGQACLWFARICTAISLLLLGVKVGVKVSVGLLLRLCLWSTQHRMETITASLQILGGLS